MDILLAFLGFFLIMCFCYIYEIGNSETRHRFHVSNIDAQSSADFNILENIVTYENILLFCFMGTQH